MIIKVDCCCLMWQYVESLYFHNVHLLCNLCVILMVFSCYFDGVKGTIANFLFTTVPLTIILILNSILYGVTLREIYLKEKDLKKTLGKQTSITKMKHTAARAMSVFVLVFLVQWWAMAVYGLWSFIDPQAVPATIYHLVTTFSNVGGILNFIVYIYIRRRLHSFQTSQGNPP